MAKINSHYNITFGRALGMPNLDPRGCLSIFKARNVARGQAISYDIDTIKRPNPKDSRAEMGIV